MNETPVINSARDASLRPEIHRWSCTNTTGSFSLKQEHSKEIRNLQSLVLLAVSLTSCNAHVPMTKYWDLEAHDIGTLSRAFEAAFVLLSLKFSKISAVRVHCASIVYCRTKIYYSAVQKFRTFNSQFSCGPLRQRGSFFLSSGSKKLRKGDIELPFTRSEFPFRTFPISAISIV